MNPVLIGNLISLAGCIVMVWIGLVRKRDNILKVQCLQFALQGLANLILGGFSGFISSVTCILRNILFLRCDPTLLLKLSIILLQALLSSPALGTGVIEWLPILSTAFYIFNMSTHSPARLKCAGIVTQSLWLTYDLYHLNIAGVFFDGFTIVSNLVGILLVKKTAALSHDE